MAAADDSFYCETAYNFVVVSKTDIVILHWLRSRQTMALNDEDNYDDEEEEHTYCECCCRLCLYRFVRG